ncbi:hypothetical protein H5V45_11580 [Nocardioides sp. KIGAM211]|uniref:Protein kinase domain-containing protein n=1 Tax=Nocardioides luti TaxID=2761101 RepID=A0A7X0VBG4_9ACTN|nr:hypothetical protein [Nocardioides luti]MBB6627957.1 hypothetical protein [Nocardioides luti]
MPNSIRPGDVLADRYRLVDLLTESEGGRFWRAHDGVLERHVALHVIGADDERAPGLLEAARRSATILDRRLLRVLDADQVDGLCFVVNEWGSGRSLDIMLVDEGPLGARRAAWLVSEVAASIAVAHDAGVAHGRLVPENVLVDRNGAIRVIGFSVDAALRGLPAGRPSTDVSDLGGLLYAALTGRWPGASPSDVTPAPQEHGRVLRPRQVRAGIPRPLDALCDEVVNPYPSHGSLRSAHDLSTARGIGDYLRDFVGDTTGMAEAEAASAPVHRQPETVAFAPLPDRPAPSGDAAAEVPPAPDATPEDAAPTPAPAPAPPPEPTVVRLAPPAVPADSTPEPIAESAESSPEPPASPAPTTPPPSAASEPTLVAVPVPPAGPGDADPSPDGPDNREARTDPDAGQPRDVPVEQPTQAGLPIFDDENDDVSWLTARTEKAPPPPPFEPPPERPLFAPDPADGRPVRTPRPGAVTTSTGDFWPWESSSSTGTGVTPISDEDDDDEVPGRSWLRLAGAIAAGLLLLVAVVVAYNLGRGKTPLGAEPDSSRPSASSPSAEATLPAVITGVSAQDFDPQGDPPDENPDLVPLALDGNPSTAWRTMTYDQNFGPGGLKTGVGLVLDLGESTSVSSVDLTTVGAATGVSVYVTDTVPTGVRGLTPAARGSVKPRGRITLDEPVTGRYVTVWLTSLPTVEGRYRGEIAEVAVRG